MQALQQRDIERQTAHRKLTWKANFTQGVSRLKHTLVALLVRPSRDAEGDRALGAVRVTSPLADQPYPTSRNESL